MYGHLPFFFSSRRRHTRLVSDWSSDVCSSDLDGNRLRVDTTVVQSDIRHPTDNTLLWDVVRVVTRLVGRLAETLELWRIKGFRDRTRSARRRMYHIQRMTTRQRHQRQTETYRELIAIAEEVVEGARRA